MIARRPTRLNASVLTGAALSFALTAAILILPSSARAADDEEVPFDSKILRGVLESFGLRKDGEAINYQERAPLVIPPSRTLPPPENSDAVIANNPAWPKDPDVQRAKAAKAAAAKEAYVSADEKFRNENRVMRPDELTPGAKAGASTRTASGPGTASTFSETNQRLSPSQLGSTGGLWNTMFGRRDDDVGRFTGEPARTSLTEPPPGYQTPSPDQPYGLSAKTTAPKATNYLIERGTDTSK
jgi:hypothetical protein